MSIAYEDALVTIDWEMNVQMRIKSKQEGAFAVKNLKLFKKTVRIRKKEVELAMRNVRADYTAYTRTRGSMLRGGGAIGKFVRSFQTIGRDVERANLAQQLAPLEHQRHCWERLLMTLDGCILSIESHYGM